MLRKLMLVTLVIIAPALSGCGGAGTAASLSGPIVGTWSGTYASSSGTKTSGALALTATAAYRASGTINPGCSTTINTGQVTASSSTNASLKLTYDIACSSLPTYSSDQSQYATLTGTFNSDDTVFSGTITEYHVQNGIAGTQDLESFTGTFKLTRQ